MPAVQERGGLFEPGLVLHAPGDLVEVQAVEVGLAEESEDFLRGAVLGEPGPGGLINAGQALDDVERERGGSRDHFVVAGDGHRVMPIFAGRREVEIILQLLRGIGLEHHIHAAGVKAAAHGQRADGDLQQHLQLLALTAGVRQDHLRAIDDVGQEFLGDVLVELFVVLMAVAVIGAEEMLRDQHAARIIRLGRFADFAVEDDQRRTGPQAVFQAVQLFLVLAGFERQVEHGQGEHHLREVPCGLGKGLRQERRLAVVQGIVGPEVVHGDQVSELLLNRQVVVVVLSPLLGAIQLLEETARLLAFFALGGKEVRSRLLGEPRELVGRCGARQGPLPKPELGPAPWQRP